MLYFRLAQICDLTFSEFKLNLFPLHLKQDALNSEIVTMLCINCITVNIFLSAQTFFSIHIILIINIRKYLSI